MTQRGNRRQTTFFSEANYRLYLFTLTRVCRRWDVDCWAYCLMPNHVHLILTPSTQASLSRAVAELHRTYTLAINRQQGWTGCLWQGRYFSFPMDEEHLLRAARYLLLNPVRSGLVKHAREWPYSSADAHWAGRSDDIVDVEPLAERVSNWDDFLAEDVPPEERERLRLHQRTGRALGSKDFLFRIRRLRDSSDPGDQVDPPVVQAASQP